MKNRPENLINIEESESLFDYYTDWLSKHKQPNTVESFSSAAAKLKKFAQINGYDIEHMGESECLEFLNWLDDHNDLCGFTASMYANDLKRMVKFYHTRGYFEYNPIDMALENFDFTFHKHPGKKKIPLSRLRSEIDQTKVPSTVVIVVLLLKTGIRRSELYNLDLRDIHLDHKVARKWMPSPRQEINSKPDTLFIDSTINEGDTVCGRERAAGNKPRSTRPIPIDKETKDTLVWWISMLPPSPSDAQPLLRNYGGLIGRPRHYDRIYKDFVNWGIDHGLRGEDSEYHIIPHWCRHWFTTKLRENIENDDIPIGTADGYIGGLRGDSADGVLDLYTHDWQEEDWISQVYRDNIPKLFVND